MCIGSSQRKLTTWAVVVVFLVAIVELNADIPDWVLDAIYEVTDDPDSVYFNTYVDLDCPLEFSEIGDIVKGELIRSRIKPLHWLDRPEGSEGLLVLDVELSCLERDRLNPVFNVDTFFGLYWFDDDVYSGSVLINWGFGSFGVGGREFILRSLEDSVEDAITAYVKANFDL